MKKLLLLLPALVVLFASVTNKPAYAWDRAWCDSHHITTGECAHWYTMPSPAPIVNNNTNNNNQHQGQHQGQHQSQSQTQTANANNSNVNSVNNRLNNSLSNMGNANVYTNIHQGAQLPMVNAPECGGVNVGGSLGYDQGPSAAVSAAMHFGRRSDTCNHYDTPSAPAPVVYVQPTTPVTVTAAAPERIIERHETVRIVHEHEDRCPSHLTQYDALKIASDLHNARSTHDIARIKRDHDRLVRACREDLVYLAIDGEFGKPLGK